MCAQLQQQHRLRAPQQRDDARAVPASMRSRLYAKTASKSVHHEPRQPQHQSTVGRPAPFFIFINN